MKRIKRRTIVIMDILEGVLPRERSGMPIKSQNKCTPSPDDSSQPDQKEGQNMEEMHKESNVDIDKVVDAMDHQDLPQTESENQDVITFNVDPVEANQNTRNAQALNEARNDLALARKVRIIGTEQSLKETSEKSPKENIGKFFDEDIYNEVKFEHTYEDTFIAKGSYGSCRQRTYTATGRTVVMKKMVGKLDSINRKELEFAAVNPHRNIVPVLGYIILPDDEEIYLFMENGGDALSSFDPKAKQYLAKQFPSIMRGCLEAVDHLHNHGNIYLDAKPQNTLINIRADGTCNAKLCDMGSLFEVGIDNKVITTPKYKPPDVLLRMVAKLTTQADVFSLGLVFYYILTGEEPWPNYKRKEEINHDLLHESNEDLFEHMCPKALGCNTPPYKLQRSMVHKDPAERPTIAECLQKLQRMKASYAPNHCDQLPEPIETMNGETVLPIVLDNPITASDEQQNDNTLVPPPATSGRGTESMMDD